jgi:membrane protein
MSEELKLSKNKKARRLSWSQIWELTKKTFSEYFTESSFRHAAALAYYTIFSLIPMIYLGVYFFGRFLGNETVHLMVSDFLHDTVGMEDVSGIMDFLKSYDVEKRNPVMETVGIITLLFSSSAFVVSLHKSINDFLDIEPVDAPVKKMILRSILSRLLAIAFIGIFGVIIILIYLAQTILLSIGQEMLSNPTLQFLFNNGLAHVASLATNFLVFTLMFKYIHDGIVRWKAAMVGALITSILVYMGQILIKFYLDNFFFAADGGVVGSLFAILAWIFYTGLILFLGAKFVKIYAQMAGIPVIPKYRAVTKNGKVTIIDQEDGKVVKTEQADS